MSNKRRLRRPPRYVSSVAQVAAQQPPRTVGIVEVRHDEWCRIWQGQACTCEPIIEPPELLIDELT
jgi:hypothetical protein